VGVFMPFWWFDKPHDWDTMMPGGWRQLRRTRKPFLPVIGAFAGWLAIRRTRREIEILNERAAAAAAHEVPIPTVLTDPRLGLGLLVAMDFVIATIITMLTNFALNFVSRPFGMVGDLAHYALQGIIVCFVLADRNQCPAAEVDGG